MTGPGCDFQRARSCPQMQGDEGTSAVVRDGGGQAVELGVDREALHDRLPNAAAPVVDLGSRPWLAVMTGEDELLVRVLAGDGSPQAELLTQGLHKGNGPDRPRLGGADDAVGDSLVD